MAIAVTGAAGFIGAAVARRLRSDGHAVVGLDLRGADVDVDIADAEAVRRALRGADAVVHAAAIVGDHGSMADCIRVNTRGTRNVLDAAAGRVVALSSVAVWGYDFTREVAEDSPPRATGVPYIDTKAATERLTLLRGHTVVRPGDVYGPGSEPWVLRPLRALQAGTFALPGRGEGVMTPVYIDDLVDGIVRALDAPGGRAYTLWDGEAVAARDFFAFHARWAGRRLRTFPRPLMWAGAAAMELLCSLAPARHSQARAFGDVTREALTYVARKATYPNTRAREELGWTPQVALSEGMARTEAWLRAENLI